MQTCLSNTWEASMNSKGLIYLLTRPARQIEVAGRWHFEELLTRVTCTCHFLQHAGHQPGDWTARSGLPRRRARRAPSPHLVRFGATFSSCDCLYAVVSAVTPSPCRSAGGTAPHHLLRPSIRVHPTPLSFGAFGCVVTGTALTWANTAR